MFSLSTWLEGGCSKPQSWQATFQMFKWKADSYTIPFMGILVNYVLDYKNNNWSWQLCHGFPSSINMVLYWPHHVIKTNILFTITFLFTIHITLCFVHHLKWALLPFFYISLCIFIWSDSCGAICIEMFFLWNQQCWLINHILRKKN